MNSRARIALLALSLSPLTTQCAPAAAPTAAAPPSPPPAIAQPAPPPIAMSHDASPPSAPLPPEIAAIQKEALASTVSVDFVRGLTDEVGPRLAGSSGSVAATVWAKKKLTALGFANVHTEDVKALHWERGLESAEMIAPYPHRFAIAALGNTIGTPAVGIEGDVIEVDSLEALDRLEDSQVKGKIVFFDPIMKASRDGKDYGRVVVIRSTGPAKASKKGAILALIRSVGTDHNRLAHAGATHMDPKESIPAAAISVPDAEFLHRVIAEKGSARVHVVLRSRWPLPDAPMPNVIGEVRGREKPDEVIVMGAHLDSWDLGVGAIDDGAGCAIVVGAAHALLAMHPKRTIRVVLFAAEENSVAGGREYAKAHQGDASKILAAMEADYGTGRAYAFRVLSDDKDSVAAKLAPLLSPLGIERSGDDAHGGSDVGPLKALGVPMIDLAQDVTTYFDFHHSANDTFDKIDPEGLAQVSAAFATVPFTVAQSESGVGRVPAEKRKASW